MNDVVMGNNDARHSLLAKDTAPTSPYAARKRRNHRPCASSSGSSNVPFDDSIKSPGQNAFTSLPHDVSNLNKHQPPQFKKVLFFFAIYLSLGTLSFFLVRNQIKGEKTNGFVDSIYFCAVTMTTVGYGDLVPDTILTKLLACVFVFSGMALVGLFLSNAADYIVEKQEILIVKAIHMHEKVGPNQILSELQRNKVKYKCLLTLFLLLVLVTVGTLFLNQVEKMKVIDAFYCVCVTMTTLGYGDKSFSTKMGRIFAVFWIVGSSICLAQFFLYLAELYTERRQKAIAKWVLTKRTTCSDLEAADLDDDKVVCAAEFIIFKLKEMGKIDQEDISPLMEIFHNLDADHSGSLTASDLLISQS